MVVMARDGFAPVVVIIAAAFLVASGAVSLPSSSPLSGVRPSEVAAIGWFSSWWSRVWRMPPTSVPSPTTSTTPPADRVSRPAPKDTSAPPAPLPTAPRQMPPAAPSRSPFGIFGDVLRGAPPPAPPAGHSPARPAGRLGEGSGERYGNRTPFHKRDGVSFEYYWPLDPVAGQMSEEETEVLVHNESGKPVAITSVGLEYTLAGRRYVPPSGSWEKFASRQSWDRTEYRIFNNSGAIIPPFHLAAGEKGKLHYHIQFAEQPSKAKTQSVGVKVGFAVGGVSYTLEETISRSGPAAAPPAAHVSATMQSPIFGVPCRSDPNVIFDQTFAPLDQVAGIVPSGAAASEEIKPHSYVDLAVESIPLWAPADLELVEGAYYYEPPTFRVPTTYSFHFQVSCEVVLMLDHITDPVEKLKNAFPKTPQQDTRSVRVQPTVRLAKGELIGYTKGGGTQSASPPINRFDLGLYRTTNVNRFINQARYERSRTWKYIHAVCPYDYFAPALKTRYYQKFTTLNKKPVPGAACRSPNQDRAGTLAGAWFFGEDSPATEAHVGIAAELDGSDVEIVGLPRRGVHASINRSNPTFKDPAAVTTEHCYFSRESGDRVLYFRLLSPMKAEVYDRTSSSGCPSAFPAAGAIPLFR